MSTALYRRYRPETFADVIGQEHVTEPLMQALRTGRVNHAYLFSGPRGCGKTTSARILARCLNCAQGPTPEPCGECDSCVQLARGGAGSVDVIEIDAASHGGVDDARDLREKASYGPAQSRYKIYIIDEAHMVTPQGFNALLKIVEEPPEHVKFVFATTEPEKVIGTIRSRTHHYPFRLVPPKRLHDYMEELCGKEGVAVAPGVLSFVTRAGGGSVRDSLSVLDQLIAGSGDEGLTYEGAAALLGFTDGELLDAVVDAFAAGDGAGVFTQIDKVIETGLDPRRFVEDLLERLRDLIVIAAVPDGASSVLRTLPEDQIERMRTQAAAFGPGALSRAADIVNQGLTEMTGATAPRLQLELICARVLLPGASGEQGYAARLDRIERRLSVGGVPQAAAGAPHAAVGAPHAAVGQPPTGAPAQSASPAPGGPDQQQASPQARQQSPADWPEEKPDAPEGGGGRAPSPVADRPGGGSTTHGGDRGGHLQGDRGAHQQGADRGGHQQGADRTPGHQQSAGGSPAQRGGPESGPTRQQPPSTAAPEQRQHQQSPPPAATGGLDVAAIRRAWPDVLGKVFAMKRSTWTFVSEHAQVIDYDGQRLVLGIATLGLAETFRRGPHAEIVRQALIDVLGIDARVEGVPTDEAHQRAAAPPPAAVLEADQPRQERHHPDLHSATQAGGPAPQGDSAGPASRVAQSPDGAPPAGGPASGLRAGAPAGQGPQGGAPAPGEAAAEPGPRGPESRAGAPDQGQAGARQSASPEADSWASMPAPDDAPPSWGEEPPPEDVVPEFSHDAGPAGPGAPQGSPDAQVPTASRGAEAARAALGRGAADAPPEPERRVVSDDDVSDDDEDIEEAGEVGVPVVERLLGGTVISEDEA
ncbi:DNA polymerase III subunit gamma and tau [Actinomycetota bacterium]